MKHLINSMIVIFVIPMVLFIAATAWMGLRGSWWLYDHAPGIVVGYAVVSGVGYAIWNAYSGEG